MKYLLRFLIRKGERKLLSLTALGVRGESNPDTANMNFYRPKLLEWGISGPLFPGRTKVIHAGFDDPPRLVRNAKNEAEVLGHYRRVRDEIRKFVESLPDTLARFQ